MLSSSIVWIGSFSTSLVIGRLPGRRTGQLAIAADVPFLLKSIIARRAGGPRQGRIACAARREGLTVTRDACVRPHSGAVFYDRSQGYAYRRNHGLGGVGRGARQGAGPRFLQDQMQRLP